MEQTNKLVQNFEKLIKMTSEKNQFPISAYEQIQIRSHTIQNKTIRSLKTFSDFRKLLIIQCIYCHSLSLHFIFFQNTRLIFAYLQLKLCTKQQQVPQISRVDCFMFIHVQLRANKKFIYCSLFNELA